MDRPAPELPRLPTWPPPPRLPPPPRPANAVGPVQPTLTRLAARKSMKVRMRILSVPRPGTGNGPARYGYRLGTRWLGEGTRVQRGGRSNGPVGRHARRGIAAS